jgi:hypothetical protein
MLKYLNFTNFDQKKFKVLTVLINFCHPLVGTQSPNHEKPLIPYEYLITNDLIINSKIMFELFKAKLKIMQNNNNMNTFNFLYYWNEEKYTITITINKKVKEETIPTKGQYEDLENLCTTLFTYACASLLKKDNPEYEIENLKKDHPEYKIENINITPINKPEPIKILEYVSSINEFSKNKRQGSPNKAAK